MFTTYSLRAAWSCLTADKTMTKSQRGESPAKSAGLQAPDRPRRPADLRTLYRCPALLKEPTATQLDGTTSDADPQQHRTSSD